jgi:subtilisin family serine protease
VRRFGSLGLALLVLAASAVVTVASPSRAVAHQPRLTWEHRQVKFTVRGGVAEERTLRFKGTGTVRRLGAQVHGDLARVLSVDVSRLAMTSPEHFELPVRLTAPAKAKRWYRGTVQLTEGRHNLGRALPVTVKVVRADAETIPATAAAPSPDRIVTTEGGQTVVGDELIVGISLDAADPAALVRDIARTHGALIIGAVPAARTYQLRFPGASLATLAAKQSAIGAVAGVEFVSLNAFAAQPLSVFPDDTEWDTWSVAAPAGNNWGMEYIDAPAAWDVTTGSNAVRVGVVDTDFDSGHSDLDDNIGRSDGRGLTAGGHGTHVAGTICAEGDNAKGVSGVAWDCDLRQFPYGRDAATTQQAMVRAVDDGVRVVNMSLQFVENNQCGTPGTNASLTLVADTNRVLGRAILYAQRGDRDVLWVFAAGNECRDAKYASPASLVHDFPTNVVTVASIDPSGGLSSFSNRGDLVTVAAPGRDIFSTLPRSCVLWICSDRYGTLSGTSMAAPHVTGLAALLFSHDGSRTAAAVKNCIVGSATVAVPGQPFSIVNAPRALACKGTVVLPPKVDIVLALDLTGSMGGVLDQAKAQVGQAVQDMKAAAPTTDFRFAVTSYEDYPATYDSSACGTSTYSAQYGDAPDAPFRINQNLTDDAGAVVAAVNGLSLGWGADGPESYGRALWEIAQADTGATLGFRPDAMKIIINFGDNVPHDPNINEGVDSPPLFADTGIDPGRNGVIDCGGDDIDFQGGAIAGLKATQIHLLTVDSSFGSSIEPYWRLWSSQTGGAYTSLAPDDGRTLSEITLELLRLIPAG